MLKNNKMYSETRIASTVLIVLEYCVVKSLDGTETKIKMIENDCVIINAMHLITTTVMSRINK